MERDYICIVPRNLNKPDKVPVFDNFSLTWKQIGYLVAGGASIYFSFSSDMDLVIQIATSAIGFVLSIACSFVKLQGAEIDEIVINSLIYTQRKIYYNKIAKERGIIVNIKSKEGESTVTTKQQAISLHTT